MTLAIGAGLSGFSLVFLILAIVTLTERSRFSPFYTQIQCTNPNIQVPFSFAMYPAASPALPSFLYFDSSADFVNFNSTTGSGATGHIIVGIDPATGHPVHGGPHNMSEIITTAAGVTHTLADHLSDSDHLGYPANGLFMKPPTQQQYGASLPIPHKVSCSNPNEFDVTINKGTGVIQATLDGVTFHDIGSATLSDVVLKAGATDYVTDLNIKMFVHKMIGQSLIPKLMQGVTNGNAPQTVPMFVSFTELDTEIEISMMGGMLGEKEKNKLPLKHCGFHVMNRKVAAVESAPWNLVGYDYFAVEPVTGLICENEKSAIAAKMFDASFVGPEMQKYAAVKPAPADRGHAKVGGGFINNLDPTQKTIDESTKKLDTMAGILTALFLCLFLGFLAAGIFLIQKAGYKKEVSAAVSDKYGTSSD